MHSAERILPSKNSESCWKGGIKFAFMWGISIPQQPWDTKNPKRKKKKIKQDFQDSTL